jgi:N-acetyl-anhydromuramyl-L-alanine amidase AmpD
MPDKRRTRLGLLVPLLLVLALGTVAQVGAAPAPAARVAKPTDRQAAFRAAAAEFGVPESILLAVSYNVSRWDNHGGTPSTSGGYGPMHLTQVGAAPLFDAKGDDQPHPAWTAAGDASLHTLDTAAALLGLSADTLKHDAAQNIRGGAALLGQYARDTTSGVPLSEADWYGAVAKYSGAQEQEVALGFADAVYASIQQGASRTTSDGQRIALAAKSVKPNKSTADNLALVNRKHTGADCPKSLDCRFIPAAYHQNNPSDNSDYGNYDLANRPADGLDIRYIVIHDTEVDYAGTLKIFQNPQSYVSTHYVLRSSDGRIAQMVDNKNVAWHAGNWYVNGHAIGLEHEGFAIDGAAWYSEQMYQASATLVRYLAQKYNIPLDRAHIIGHDDIPHPTQLQQVMHWDPGPFWDWAHYMELIGAPISSSGSNDSIVTIKPNFATNTPPLLSCEGGVAPVEPQSASFVYLRTAPSADAPYVANPYIGSAPTCANNWGNKASTGQSFYRFAREGDWDGIYFSGQQAWFYNPGGANTVSGSGTLVTPKAGVASIPVYGRAYPEASAYPAGTIYQTVTPINNYSIPAGQIYVASGLFKSDYYWAPTYSPTLEGSDHVVVKGQTEYYQIFYNHRFAFVKASDVDLVAP